MSTIIRELEPLQLPFGGGTISRWELRCECGETFTANGHKAADGKCARCNATIDAAKRAEQRKRAIEARVQSTIATIPQRYAWAAFDEPLLSSRVRPASAIAKAQAAVSAPSVVILGSAGTGKTSLACALLRATAESRSTRGRFASAFALAKARQEHPLGNGEAPAIEKALSAKLLLLDELGAEFSRNTAVQEVIHERHAEELPTIYTSGFDADELAKRYGDGIARRIFEGATVIRLGERVGR